MASSFKDQLLKAGLVDRTRLHKEKRDKTKNSIQQRRKAPVAPPPKDDAKDQAQSAAAERDRQLNLQRKLAADRKALAAQLKQLIEANRLPRGDGDVAYHFTDNNKIQRVFVSAVMHKQITGGSLAIVRLNAQYDVVPAAIVDKLRERNAGVVIVWMDPQNNTGDKDREDEGDHPVPDDLIW